MRESTLQRQKCNRKKKKRTWKICLFQFCEGYHNLTERKFNSIHCISEGQHFESNSSQQTVTGNDGKDGSENSLNFIRSQNNNLHI